MMDRIYSGVKVISCSVPASSFHLFLMQCAPATPQGLSGPKEVTLPTSSGDILRMGSLDVDSSNIVLIDIWHSALKEVLDSTSCVTVPFWRNDSERAAIESRLTEFEISESNEPAPRTR